MPDIFGCGTTAAPSATASGAAANGGGSWMTLLIPLLLFVVIIVVMIIPQRRREKKVKDMLSAMKVGDKVRTIGGIYGTIYSVKDDTIVLEVADKVTITFAKNAIATVVNAEVENTAKIEPVKEGKSKGKDKNM